MFSFSMFPFSVLLLFSIIFRTITCDPSIIVIGAGASGIAAATRLLKNNFTNLVILEAQDRIGGRVNSVKFGDAYVDLGAEWCHGEKDNLVFEMVKDLNVLSLSNHDPMRAYYSNKKEIPIELNNRLYDIINDIYTPSGDKNQPEGVNLGDYCKQEYNRMVSNLNVTDPTQTRFIKDFVPYFEHYVLSSEGSFSWFDPSAESDYRDCEGRLDWTWSGLGYKTALETLMHKFPKNSGQTELPIDDKLLLNKDVKKIYWDNSNNKVTVACSDNSSYTADFVIFTPSIGVLKEQHRDIFEPVLPKYKINAIDKIGFGSVMKVMLQFSEPWWPASGQFPGFSFVWAEEHRKSTSDEFQLNGKSWLLAMSEIYPVENNPSVLSMWFLGPNVPYIETLDEESLLEGIDYGLNLFLGHKYNVSHPIAFIRSNWYTNPHFRGTYSFQTVASRKVRSNVHLSEPLTNRNGKEVMFFAGEATSPYRYSAVHGAIETGYREADRIINLHNEL